MSEKTQSFKFSIPYTYTHQVEFTHGVFECSNPLFKEILNPVANKQKTVVSPKILVVIDAGLIEQKQNASLLQDIKAYCALHRIELKQCMVLKGGEVIKNDSANLQTLYQAIQNTNLCRQSYLVAIGGGALLDMVGFAAATAHRGIRLIRIPTTTLSQADSGVGVKNGVNFFGKKNWLGSFNVPFAVINDFNFIRSQPAEQKRAGIIEALKVAVIKDAEFYAFIKKHTQALIAFEQGNLERLIQQSARIHAEHIAFGGDPFELTSARPLDFGHWAAHKMEQLSNFSLSHGDAVAIGIALDLSYAEKTGLLDSAIKQEIIELIQAFGFPLYHPVLHLNDKHGKRSVLSGIEEFREHLGGQLNICMATGIGASTDINKMEGKVILQCIEGLQHAEQASSCA